MVFPGFPGVLSFFQVFQVEWEPWKRWKTITMVILMETVKRSENYASSISLKTHSIKLKCDLHRPL